MARKKCLRILTELRFCKNRLVSLRKMRSRGIALQILHLQSNSSFVAPEHSLLTQRPIFDSNIGKQMGIKAFLKWLVTPVTLAPEY